jgi:hypothetical protein
MITLPGGCYCGSVRFKVEFEDWDVLEGKKKDEGKEGVRTSLCHCGNCKVRWRLSVIGRRRCLS